MDRHCWFYGWKIMETCWKSCFFQRLSWPGDFEAWINKMRYQCTFKSMRSFYIILAFWPNNHVNTMGLGKEYPLVNIQKAIENGPVEIVDFPINSMVIFHCKLLVHQRVCLSLGVNLLDTKIPWRFLIFVARPSWGTPHSWMVYFMENPASNYRRIRKMEVAR